jgi:acetyl-CoA C-acetyltransferase
MQAVILGYELLQNHQEITAVAAGGLENMTNAPYLLTKARSGHRLGHGEIKDHMFLDGLEDAYENKLMGSFAEDTATAYHFSRESQDEFAINSVEKAKQAVIDKNFVDEIAPVEIKGGKETIIISEDEGVKNAKPEKIPNLKPAFKKDGTVTAANSSSISDGAAALILMRASTAQAQNIKPLAKIMGYASYSHEPAWFTTAPVGAMRALLKQLSWTVADVDLFEVNEAFAVVTMAAMHDLQIPAEKINVHGGACVLGHPIGASGARILVTLLYARQQKGLKRGIASLCIGGGEGLAIAIELV